MSIKRKGQVMRPITTISSVAFLITGVAVFIVLAQQSEVIFVGSPVRKVSEAGLSRIPEKLSPEKASASLCVISKVGAEYYWTSRNNLRLYRVESGAFITYLAPGTGYVRIIMPDMKVSASLMSETEASFDYIEHMTLGLRTVTYWGKKVGATVTIER